MDKSTSEKDWHHSATFGQPRSNCHHLNQETILDNKKANDSNSSGEDSTTPIHSLPNVNSLKQINGVPELPFNVTHKPRTTAQKANFITAIHGDGFLHVQKANSITAIHGNGFLHVCFFLPRLTIAWAQPCLASQWIQFFLWTAGNKHFKSIATICFTWCVRSPDSLPLPSCGH